MSTHSPSSSIPDFTDLDIGDHVAADDLDGEKESLDAWDDLRGSLVSADGNSDGANNIFAHLQEVSVQVVAVRTAQGYASILKKFIAFCIAKGWIPAGSTLNEAEVPVEMPKYLCVYIANECDEIDLETGKQRAATVVRGSYAHATKIRSAVSHHYARVRSRGKEIWKVDADGKTHGNPSLSVIVSNYIMSLRRRKRNNGDVVTSARAFTPAVLRAIFDSNFAFAALNPIEVVPRRNDPLAWANANTRVMLYFLYVLSFWCLLRSDEALNIKWHELKLDKDEETGEPFLRVTLPFRKTHQFGDIAPFFLYEDKQNPHMCPVQAYIKWYGIMKPFGTPDGARLEGYVFRNPIAGGTFSDEGLKSSRFLEFLRHNLLDAHLDPFPYGTHSFRRGGAQHLYKELRWDILDICDWGGWSLTDSQATLFKYLYSWVDSPERKRSEMLKPNRTRRDKCYACGRSCNCHH